MLSSGQLFLKRHIWLISQCFIFPPLLFSSQWNRLIWAWHEVTSEQLPTLCIFFLFNPFSIFSWDYYCKNLLWPCFCSGPKRWKVGSFLSQKRGVQSTFEYSKEQQDNEPILKLRNCNYFPCVLKGSKMDTIARGVFRNANSAQKFIPSHIQLILCQGSWGFCHWTLTSWVISKIICNPPQREWCNSLPWKLVPKKPTKSYTVSWNAGISCKGHQNCAGRCYFSILVLPRLVLWCHLESNKDQLCQAGIYVHLYYISSLVSQELFTGRAVVWLYFWPSK